MDKTIEQRISSIEENLYLTKNVFTFEEACRFLGLSKSYLYKLTCSSLIPHYKPQGKMLYFDKQELEEWVKQNHISVNPKS